MIGIAAIGIGVATIVLALSYALGGLWAWVSLIILVGGLWQYGLRRHWSWVASLALVCFVGLAAGGRLQDLAPGWIVLGVVTSLSAWDLHHFAQRLRAAESIQNERETRRRHLQRLALVNGLGLLLATAALEIRIKFSLGIAFLLGLLAILGLSRASRFLRRESD